MTLKTRAGTVLASRYRLEELMASGGVGEVWRAADLVLERPVAAKLLKPSHAHHPEARVRFKAEARSAASLAHAGIAQVYDYDEGGEGRLPYLVMELVDGPSLAQVLAAGRMDPVLAMDVVAQVAAGLEAAHAAGIVHRDIKPGNVLITRDGVAKITDFGIAQAVWSASVTSSDTLVGTPAYLAPERAAGAMATAACDLYSLGVVGYECLTGNQPFRGDAIEVAESHQYRAMPELPPDVPADVAALVSELTAKDPMARPRSAKHVAERAALLRSAMTSGARGAMPWPGLASAVPPGWEPVTLADPLARPLPLAARWLSRARQPARLPRPGQWRGGRAAVLAAAACAAVGLGGWAVGEVIGAGQPPITAAAGQATTGSSAAHAIDVNGSEFVGRSVGVVLGQLGRLGLQPSVVWERTSASAPGTVLSVDPDGRLLPGSAVVVRVALAWPIQVSGQDGSGDGNGGGDGGPGGGGSGDGGGGGGN